MTSKFNTRSGKEIKEQSQQINIGQPALLNRMVDQQTSNSNHTRESKTFYFYEQFRRSETVDQNSVYPTEKGVFSQ
jgi:hypothetical protein